MMKTTMKLFLIKSNILPKIYLLKKIVILITMKLFLIKSKNRNRKNCHNDNKIGLYACHNDNIIFFVMLKLIDKLIYKSMIIEISKKNTYK